ncbi:MAG: HEPN domain-containing protein [bacterium]
MKEETREYISMRMRQAEEALADARALFDVRESWTGTINRAYYSVFYAATAALATRDLSAFRHSGVVSMFGRELSKPGIVAPELGRIFHRLFELRQRSDYHSPAEPTRETADECVGKAEKFVCGIKDFLIAGKWLDEKED